ncbi:uncharacterized protein LOC127850484 [Dreissena polymorpha]|uniref:Uncharacterized protein n=1 Tax=Dreissena polymorpha TaxID=45954 RepID=A0A9D4D0A2_DREPO|nr:uncharacterized protein LOC127850484 [Dreissena polymorpha]XP_052239531.1 uncharacterized protein LOC127850484 [Dreissena polymorpha]XP_052239532.1 uncharacterized protein LOC127850484 [Dreissena polymorpha]XP_052239533.1 uncharacterized protein LOC127850484 [Dreissena polymorpha]XP_052239534.1 uncharacterized protein LOC127850484 [Dreissena polymorpha]XP_052239535.1 uncharacterized protein LOC127850484 [Dreissena polymorpha]XP_052239536.1 uncharacterized protein LOC127850484 [Dreissena po
MTSLLRRTKSASARLSKQYSEPDLQNTFNVRFDYSDTYLDNEELDHQLENQSDELNRERYRAGVEADELLKKTKKDADEKMQLKNKIKNRNMTESTDRVTKSANIKRKLSQPVCVRPKSTVAKERIEEESEDNPDGNDTLDEIAVGIKTTDNSDKPRAFHNLTMFLLALHRRKPRTAQNKSSDKKDYKIDRLIANETVTKSDAGNRPAIQNLTQTRPSVVLSRRPASYHVGDARGKTPPVDTDKAQYGIHVQKDFTRSRRTLGDISKLEQDAKYGFVNKFEERRKRLLAECRDTGALNDRIKYWMKDVDELKILSSPENSLERVLLRSKASQQMQRSS